MSNWSDAQLTTLKYISFFPALLSMLGSSCIIAHVIRKDSTTKNRLLLGLSLNDVLSSFWVSIGAALVPSRGRKMCNLQGFFVQYGSSTTLYTACLSLYFLLQIRYNVPPTRMKRLYEPLFHGICILYPLVTAIACLPMDLYNPVFVGCHIEAYPQGCNRRDDETCLRGNQALLFFWLFTAGPLLVVFGTVLVSQLLIYWTVRQQVLANRRYAVTPRPSDERMVQEVARQSLAYVLAFLAAFLLPSIATYVELFSYGGLADPKYFPLFLLILFCYPLQGFVNYLVFQRVAYMEMRSHHPDWPWYKVFYQTAVTLNPKPPPTRTLVPRKTANTTTADRDHSLSQDAP